MVRALFLASRSAWQAFSGSEDSQKRENDSCIHRGRVQGRIIGWAGFAKGGQKWHALRLKGARSGRDSQFEFCGRRKNGNPMVGFRRKSRVEPLIFLCMSEGADDGGSELDGRVQKTEANSPIVDGEEEGKGVTVSSTGGERSVDVGEKIDKLNEMELQPFVSKRGWLEQLKRATAGFLGFMPVIPFPEEFFCVPREQTGPRIVWDGWGTSLCWWANFVGGLPEIDMDYVLDLLFDQSKGLGLNIARYNIGGGADLKFDTNLRPFSDIPGFKQGPEESYDWSADERQRKVLLGAKARGANLFEAFSNSPPRWMTHSGSVTGNWWKGQDNLKPEFFAAFANYLTDVVHHYEKNLGLHFNYLAPFNEPVEGFWNLDRKRPAQEGCNFTVQSINQLIPHVKSSLASKGLSTQITAADSWSLNTAKVLRGLGQETLDAVSQINVHTYIPFVQRESDARREEVRRMVNGLGKRLWMSEYGPLNWGGTELDVALAVGRHITLDINELQASAWCYWQVLEIPGKNFYWGLLHAEFKYQMNGVDPFKIHLKKQYYIMMHFSRWIRPGFTIFVSEGMFADWLVMAVDPSTNATVVLVFTNTSDRNIDIKFDVSGIAPGLSDSAVQAALVRTSETENHKELTSQDYSSPEIIVRIVAKSITTIIVSKPNAIG